MDLVARIREIVEPAIVEAGYILDEVKYEQEGSSKFLRLIIDKEGFITVDDCVIVCRLVNPILDEKDPIEENYILDVCSKEKGSDYDGQ